MRFLPLLAALFLSAPAAAQDPAETAFAKAVLNQLQTASIAANREYCGYIGYDTDGRLKATKAKKGRIDSCYSRRAPRRMEVIASFHTHAGFDPGADSEVPSVDDMFADEEEGIDGYVSTPGGRLWFIDTRSMTTRQVCGRKCMLSDAGFRREVFGPVRRSYTIRQLIAREDGNG